MRPVGWPFYGLCAVVLAGFLWESLKPHAFFSIIVLAGTLWILGPLWLMRMAVALVLRRIYKQRDPSIWRFLGRFACVLLLPGIMLLLISTSWMEHVGFWLARPAMERLIADVRAVEAARVPPSTEPTSHPSRRVGPFYAVDVQFNPASDTVQFYVDGAGFIDPAGFVHSAHSGKKPKLPARFIVESPCDDHWWFMHFDF